MSNIASLTSEQACNILPRITPSYTSRGTWSTLINLKTYISQSPTIPTGSISTKQTAILYIYDIYGFCPQNELGADLLSQETGADVFVVDMHDGKSLDQNKLKTMSSEEAMEYRAAFRAGFPGNIESQRKPTHDIFDELKKRGYKRIGAVGFCWGGNLLVQIPIFDAIAMVHPGAAVNPESAKGVNVPTCLLPSMNEDETSMEGFHAIMKTKPFADKCVFKWYKHMPHGWAAARANLDDEKGREAFADAYGVLSKFFADNL